MRRARDTTKLVVRRSDTRRCPQSATIQIEAVGTFVSPEEGGYEAAGRGSGFLVSSDGIAVTNNHVVVGAGTLDVWLGGDTDKTYNAKILGSSECLDLAVVQLPGDSFPFFEWRKGEIKRAIDVYAAGFPLGDPTFTMTRGIVSKASTPGETPWASLDSVIEHDARIRGGNSGGPLVDEKGRLVGVNYAGNNTYDTNLAIPVFSWRKSLIRRTWFGSDQLQYSFGSFRATSHISRRAARAPRGSRRRRR